MFRSSIIKVTMFIFMLSAAALSQGGKLSFSHNEIQTFDRTTQHEKLKLINLTGNHGLKALQLQLSFSDSNLKFIDISKGRDIDSPDWSLQYNVKKNPDNPSNVIVYVLLYNISVGELPPGNYRDFINYEYEINSIASQKEVSKIKISAVKGSWFNGTDANISSDTLQTIFIRKKREHHNANEFYQNYPNPFNPETTISYYLPRDNFIKLKIYNSVGEEIAIMIDEFQTEGYHSIKYEAPSDLPSGVYFCVLNGDEFNLTKKILLLK